MVTVQEVGPPPQTTLSYCLLMNSCSSSARLSSHGFHRVCLKISGRSYGLELQAPPVFKFASMAGLFRIPVSLRHIQSLPPVRSLYATETWMGILMELTRGTFPKPRRQARGMDS